jgi:hypothetical protein
MYTLKDRGLRPYLVVGGKTAKFKQYRLGNLYYETQEGFIFAIPLHDLDGVTLGAEEKCSLLMKWIKRGLQEMNEDQASGQAGVDQ